jgi:FdhD protein
MNIDTNTDTPVNQQTSAAVWNWKAGVAGWRRDEVVVEEPLEIRVNGHAVSVTMRTPGFDEELAAGFLLAERVVSEPRDAVSIARGCSGRAGANVINVTLASGVGVDLQHLTRHVFAGSSCGLCGTVAIDAIAKDFPPVTSDVLFPAGLLAALPDRMAETQLTFQRTGGLHAAALFDETGELLVLREDVGRHNAVDKVIGRAFLDGWLPLSRHALVVSGRTSFEIIQKALAARIPVIAAVSAPSSLAVAFAQQSGQTLVGFARGDRMNVYTHRHRIDCGAEA